VKRKVQGEFEAALDMLDSFQRKVARWEEDCLVRAMAAMVCDAYLDASLEVAFFHANVTAAVERRLNTSKLARPRPFSTAMLRKGLRNMRALGFGAG
jgi:hypothetical protein